MQCGAPALFYISMRVAQSDVGSPGPRSMGKARAAQLHLVRFFLCPASKCSVVR